MLTGACSTHAVAGMTQPKYVMTISRLTVDKLGVRLYDRVSAVIAEIIANSYDADATKVTVRAPMGEWLATKVAKVITDKGFVIEVVDNGVGMPPDEINDFYLKVGAERRKDRKRGDRSKIFRRKVMGRKGVGKLAPFGVCRFVEVISAGGKQVIASNDDRGYQTAHFILDREAILSDTDRPYLPELGDRDGQLSPRKGTTIKLRGFGYRRVPTMDDFERQLAQRFGLSSDNWQITLADNTKQPSESTERDVGEFQVGTMERTTIKFETLVTNSSEKYQATGPDGALTDFQAGFGHDSVFYPITGWVGYSEKPYRDDLMAGVRIYCRGKIATQTRIFNMKAGFTGEYDVRSYLVGQLTADWLDSDEDLIRTDRQDILWSHDLGQAFEAWGQDLVRKIGALTREPRRKKAWEQFREASNIEAKITNEFPLDDQSAIRDSTLTIAKQLARTTAPENLDDQAYVDSLTDLSMLLGPHITLDQKLRDAVDEQHDALSVITVILKIARVAELSAFGQIAEDRIKVIRRVEQLKDDPDTLEAAFQKLIESAPWLIDPQWSPVAANQSFSTLKTEFQKFYKNETGQTLDLDPFELPNRRADFVLSNNDQCLEIVEIKKPGHGLEKTEMERVNTYVELMEQFLKLPGNSEFHQLFPRFHVTLVCDTISLSGVHRTAFDGLVKANTLTHLTWAAFLRRTRKMHEAFLAEAERQRRNATNSP